MTPDEFKKVLNEARHFQDILTKFRQMQVDATEYACLKTIILFKTGINQSANMMTLYSRRPRGTRDGQTEFSAFSAKKFSDISDLIDKLTSSKPKLSI
jgi:hypothetical protein